MYPHPKLVVPQTLLHKPAAYTRTISSLAAFDVTTEDEAEILAESFGEVSFRTPGYAVSRHPNYVAEVLKDAPAFYCRGDVAPGDGGAIPCLAIPAGALKQTGPHLCVGTGPLTLVGAGRAMTTVGTETDSTISGAVADTYKPWVPTTQRTLSLWFYRTQHRSAKAALISGTSRAGTGTGMFLYVGDATTSFRSISFGPRGTAGAIVTWTDCLPVGPNTGGLDTWHHLALTFDDVTNAARLFVNGVFISSINATAGTDSNSDANYLRLGHWYDGAAMTYPLFGRLAEVAVFNSIVSDARIAAWYAAR